MMQCDEIVEFDAAKISNLIQLGKVANAHKGKNKLFATPHKSDMCIAREKLFFSSPRKAKRTFEKANTWEKNKEHTFMETTLSSDIGSPKWMMPTVSHPTKQHQHNFSSLNCRAYLPGGQ